MDSNEKQTRRIFLNELVETMTSASLIAGVFGSSGFSGARDGSVLTTIKLSENRDLEKVGGFVLVKDTAEGELIIVRSGDEQYSALSNVCPHRQCRVEVKGPTLIQCPCHQSGYKTDGTYVSGPAKASLRKFAVTVEGDLLTVLRN